MNQQEKPAIYEDEINLYDYCKVIVKRKSLIIGLFLVAILASAIISFLMPKIYRGEVVLKLTTKELTTKELTTKELTTKELLSIIGKPDGERIKTILPKTHNFVSGITLNELKGSADKLQVFIESKNPDRIPDIIAELVEYMNNYPLIKRYVEQEKERLLK
ncbi:MAG: Wzz/FepE/Etk N-terminal domain-containing protein, partial [Candidatus Thermoplasmatota archaeon]